MQSFAFLDLPSRDGPSLAEPMPSRSWPRTGLTGRGLEPEAIPLGGGALALCNGVRLNQCGLRALGRSRRGSIERSNRKRSRVAPALEPTALVVPVGSCNMHAPDGVRLQSALAVPSCSMAGKASRADRSERRSSPATPELPWLAWIVSSAGLPGQSGAFFEVLEICGTAKAGE